MFEVGQRVVCVDVSSNPGRAWLPGCAPKLGAVYTIRSFALTTREKLPGVRLVGMRNVCDGEVDAPYRAARFEPLPKKTTSIEVFQRMLLPNAEPVK